jgi:ferric-dicitrate binding protein FerR (iron transport regulator)
MNPEEARQIRLLKWLDGRLSNPEREAVERELRDSPEARAALRRLAEEAVMLADVERAAMTRRVEDPWPRAATPPTPYWRWAAAAVLLLGLLGAGVGVLRLREGQRELARVVRVTGASGVFGAQGSLEQPLPAGVRLRSGDMIETRSCDSWVELELRDGSRLTVAGNSLIRLLEPEADSGRVSLLRGTLWYRPASNEAARAWVVETPAARVESGRAQFDVQASANQTLLRVNSGEARITHRVQPVPLVVSNGFQASLDLAGRTPSRAEPQPAHVGSWRCDLDAGTSVILGRWLPSGADERVRLEAEPLLWPLPDAPPLMLHAVAVSALQTAGGPVELRTGARVRFQGRTLRSSKVRFGFSTQRMQGVYSGKFEVDVSSDDLGMAGDPWTVDLPLSAFHPLHPELSASPVGLELGDIYALTVNHDAGLEVHRIEIVAP